MMHEREVAIDAGLVARLIASQFPGLAGLPITEVRSTGTVNAVYRVGDRLYARMPRLEEWQGHLDRELRWLPELAARLSLGVPEPVGVGRPGNAYPCSWAVYEWIEGSTYADALAVDELRAAADLAQFVTELRGMDPSHAPTAGRRALLELDTETRAAIVAAGGAIDGAAVMVAWERALEAPPFTGTPVWIHADLLRPNLLVRDGRLSAVIDWGGAGVGDPATDVIPAWSVFGPPGRAAYRDVLGVDDDTWERARGIALHQAAAIIPYYRESNPAFVELAQRTVEQILAPD